MDFSGISYLLEGSERHRSAFSLLLSLDVFGVFHSFEPILVGTFPINIDIESSDLDIICSFDNAEDFKQKLIDSFGSFSGFEIRETMKHSGYSVIANFFVADFEIEIFGQKTPSKEQYAYKHMLIEHALLQKMGEEFRQEIIALKKQGFKTEPAFAKVLGLKGDPYEALLALDHELCLLK
ncbi:DUF4269 domain-containing protein [Belliella kenyensis]|uniref:DUF4269 domain-containing protein n=1 Tax=Belliella kenyensis TaxID=1472724 RepID=A0ABV8EJU0_9BACT|nr:DUF4269 domain-containing protein [Belliella kenyensis]MCH7403206.1 DUF4269 domain-containing protein [Belliella kenyensis]MDN3604817.1 DUF4269 domain-containing protein [Belliella kenyensis]